MGERQRRMGEAPILPLILTFGVPAMISQFVQVSYSIIDSIFVGQARGELGLAALTVCFPAILGTVAVAMLAAVGASILFGIRLGQGRLRSCARIFGSTITHAVITAIILGIFGYFGARWMVEVSGATDAIVADAAAYLRIYVGLFIVQSLGYTINAFITGCGHPLRATVTQVVAAVSNIVLDYIFVIRWDWGVEGAAWATVLGWTLGVATAAQFFFSRHVPFQLTLSSFRPSWFNLRKTMAYGLPGALMTCGAMLSLLIVTRVVTHFGGQSWVGAEGGLAMYNVVRRGYEILLIPGIGIAMGCSTLFSYNFGAGKFQRLRRIFWTCAATSIVILAVVWVPVLIFGREIMMLFGLPDNVTDYAGFLMRISVILAPVVVFEIVAGTLFQGAGKYVQATFLNVMRSLVVTTVLAIIFPIWLAEPLGISPFTAIYVAEPVSDVLMLVVTLVLMVPFLARMRAVERGEMTIEEARLTPPADHSGV